MTEKCFFGNLLLNCNLFLSWNHSLEILTEDTYECPLQGSYLIQIDKSIRKVIFFRKIKFSFLLCRLLGLFQFKTSDFKDWTFILLLLNVLHPQSKF